MGRTATFSTGLNRLSLLDGTNQTSIPVAGPGPLLPFLRPNPSAVFDVETLSLTALDAGGRWCRKRPTLLGGRPGSPDHHLAHPPKPMPSPIAGGGGQANEVAQGSLPDDLDQTPDFDPAEPEPILQDHFDQSGGALPPRPSGSTGDAPPNPKFAAAAPEIPPYLPFLTPTAPRTQIPPTHRNK